MSVFVALLLICTIGGGVHAVFTPADSAALKAAVGTCAGYNTITCTGGCLGETPDGSCPIFAASNDTTGNPYGVMGDWDVFNVTSLDRSTSTPPSCFCCPLCIFHLNSVHSRLVAFFFYVFSILIIFGFFSPTPTSSYSVLWC